MVAGAMVLSQDQSWQRSVPGMSQKGHGVRFSLAAAVISLDQSRTTWSILTPSGGEVATCDSRTFCARVADMKAVS
jgi:chaperone required for assembly of F1-ATPase